MENILCDACGIVIGTIQKEAGVYSFDPCVGTVKLCKDCKDEQDYNDLIDEDAVSILDLDNCGSFGVGKSGPLLNEQEVIKLPTHPVDYTALKGLPFEGESVIFLDEISPKKSSS